MGQAGERLLCGVWGRTRCRFPNAGDRSSADCCRELSLCDSLSFRPWLLLVLEKLELGAALGEVMSLQPWVRNRRHLGAS